MFSAIRSKTIRLVPEVRLREYAQCGRCHKYTTRSLRICILVRKPFFVDILPFPFGMLEYYRKSRDFGTFLYFFIYTNPPGYKCVSETEGCWLGAWEREEVGVSQTFICPLRGHIT